MTLEFQPFVRKPFNVQAIEVTRDNLEQIATELGLGEVKVKEGTNTRYIQVNPAVIPNVSGIFPGFWVTKMGNNMRCYTRRIFFEQFMEMDRGPFVRE